MKSGDYIPENESEKKLTQLEEKLKEVDHPS